MSVSKQDNTLAIRTSRENKISLALRLMLDGIHRTSLPRTPMQYGNLRADVIKSVTGLHGEIRWSKNYAIYQEKKQFTHYTTSGTGPHFAENAVKAEQRQFSKYLKQAGL